jgi:lipopolysaccharide/colanic/teichoic acid biosynthesis glycosyltransferase
LNFETSSSGARRNAIYRRFGKRTADLSAGIVLLIFTAPIQLGIAIALVAAQRAHPIFTQERVGKDERVFRIFKFRTMNEVRGEDGALLPDAERLTWIGRKIRSSSLDELPQLINVVRGDMSFVGPRPLLVSYLAFYSEQERIRHTVRPGITGLAQVNGRNTLSWNSRLRFDIEYVARTSISTDLRIVVQTLGSVIGRSGVQVDTRAGTLEDLDVERSR